MTTTTLIPADHVEIQNLLEKHHVGLGSMANGKRYQSTNIVIEGLSVTNVSVSNDTLVLEAADMLYLMASGRYNNSVMVKPQQAGNIRLPSAKLFS
jgi:hypothetical protein